MTYEHSNAVRRLRPLGEWRAAVPRPSTKALQAITDTAARLEYITPSTAAIAAGITRDEAAAYLELLADARIVSEPLPNDRQAGRAVYVDRKEVADALGRLRAVHLTTNPKAGAA